MIGRPTRCLATAAVVLTASLAAAQAPPRTGEVLNESAPFQCWWRSAAGAVRLGEIVEVSLTCAVLERDELRAVPDESRLTVAAIQLTPFEIVGGSNPPDMRSDDRRFFEYRYQLRIIDADVIGRDVKLPPLSIPYRVESRVGAGSTLAGRDLVHLMPQLVFRVVSQVPADATDIRDASDAGLARIDALRFRASALRVAAIVLAVLAAIVVASALPALLGRLRGRRRGAETPVSDHAVLQAAATRLAALVDANPTGDLDAAAVAQAHHLVRLVAGIAAGHLVRQAPLGRGAAVPEGRIAVDGRLRRVSAAVTSNATVETVNRAIAALPASTGAGVRARLEGLAEALGQLTRLQYAAEPPPDASGVLDGLRTARDAARALARERRWTFGRPPAPAPATLVRDL